MPELDAQTITARSALHAGTRPDAVAIIADGCEITYRELHLASNRTAHALLAEGLRPGSRVGYLGKESAHYYDIAIACAKSGTVLVPVNWRLAAGEVDHVLRDSGAELLFVEREFLPVAERARGGLTKLATVVEMDRGRDRGAGFLDWRAARPDSDPGVPAGTEDAVAQMYTSGTTGLPKGVVLPHRTFFTFIDNMNSHGVDWIDWRPEDRSLTCFPGLHAGGYAWFMHCFNVGATSVVMRMFVAEEAIRLIREHAVTTMWAAPAMLQLILAEPAASVAAFRSLRKIVYGGSPIDGELLRRCVDGFGCALAQAYAAAETGSFVTCLPPHEHRLGTAALGSAGRLCPGNDIKIVDDDDNELPPGHIGQICVRSPARFLGYWQRPAETAQTIRGDWLYMGDAGYLDNAGYLFLRDRINDTIIVAGQNIYPVEIENVLREHPAVADVAVYGVPDPRWGEAVRAAVVLRPDTSPTARDLMLFLRGRIADFKIPNGYSFVGTLPRNPTGKVLRRVLRDESALAR